MLCGVIHVSWLKRPTITGKFFITGGGGGGGEGGTAIIKVQYTS